MWNSRALNYYTLLGRPSSCERRKSRRSLWDSDGMVSEGAGRLARPAGGESPGPTCGSLGHATLWFNSERKGT